MKGEVLDPMRTKRKTGRPHDMVIAMADQIKGVIQRYIKKARPVILSHHGQDNSDPKLPLFPSSVASAAANNFRIFNNR